MDEKLIRRILDGINDKIANGKDKPSFRDCFIAALCAKCFTLKKAREISEKGILMCDWRDMNVAVSLRNDLRIQEMMTLNTNENMIVVYGNLNNDIPLCQMNEEIRSGFKESAKLVKEIQTLTLNRNFENEEESIIKLFDEDTQKRCKVLFEKTFRAFRNIFNRELIFTRADGTVFNKTVEQAETQEEMNTGLSVRPYIPDEAGMLYEFKTEICVPFTTQYVVRELSVAYMNHNGEIVEMVDRMADDASPYINSIPSQYVLEVPKGWFTKNNVKLHEHIKLGPVIANI